MDVRNLWSRVPIVVLTRVIGEPMDLLGLFFFD